MSATGVYWGNYSYWNGNSWLVNISQSVFLGTNAGLSNQGPGSVAIGYNAGKYNQQGGGTPSSFYGTCGFNIIGTCGANGSSWSFQTTNNNIPITNLAANTDGSIFIGIYSGSNGSLIQNSPGVYISTSGGNTWAPVLLGSGNTPVANIFSYIISVTYVNGLFVIVGVPGGTSPANIVYSTNGISWTSVQYSFSTPYNIANITYKSPYWIIGFYNPTGFGIAYNNNTTLTASFTLATTNTSMNSVYSIAFIGNIGVAVGVALNSSTIQIAVNSTYTSSGGTWSASTSNPGFVLPTSLSIDGFGIHVEAGFIKHSTVNADGFIIIGSNVNKKCQLAYSVNGTSWNPIYLDNLLYPITNTAGIYIKSLNGIWIMSYGGQYGQFYYTAFSDDGLNWNNQINQPIIPIYNMVFVSKNALPSIAIGVSAGNDNQGGSSIAIGNSAGLNSQASGTDPIPGSIAIGNYSGLYNQSNNAVSIGNYAGNSAQGNKSIAIGTYSGNMNQSFGALSIGYESGLQNQGCYSIALGYQAGRTNQGEYSIAIGYGAGYNGQVSNSIIINATPNYISSVTNGFIVKPIRTDTTVPSNVSYNTNTNEITYNQFTTSTYELFTTNTNPTVTVPITIYRNPASGSITLSNGICDGLLKRIVNNSSSIIIINSTYTLSSNTFILLLWSSSPTPSWIQIGS